MREDENEYTIEVTGEFRHVLHIFATSENEAIEHALKQFIIDDAEDLKVDVEVLEVN